MRPFRLTLACAAVLAGACAHMPIDPYSGGREQQPVSSAGWGHAGGAAVMYARDGTPVPPPSGPVATTGKPIRDLADPSEGSRPYMLELYQSVIEQNEELVAEVESLTAALRAEREERQAVDAGRDGLEQEVRALEQRLEELGLQNLDLARRLTTAQIRRLEAEKLLLETTIAAEKAAPGPATASEDGR